MKRKLLTVLIATTAVINLSTVAYAATETNVSSAIEIQNAIIENMRNRETNFTIHYQGADDTVVYQLNDIIDLATGTSIDEYLNLSFKDFNPSISGSYTDFVMVVSTTYLTTKEQEQFVDDKVTEIMPTIVTPGMNEKQKIQAIHKYIVDHVAYDYSLKERTAYTALYDGKTVCMGYSMLLQKMAQKVGMECHIVKGGSNAGYHAWNKVKVDGTWYNIDATTDDSLSSDVVFCVTDQFLWDNDYRPDAYNPALPVANTVYVRDTTFDEPLTIATNAVSKVESSMSQSDFDSAQTLVNALPDGEDKTNLLNKLDVVQNAIKTALTIATNEVVIAEGSKSQTDVIGAKFLVDELPNGTAKTDLLNRLTVVQNAIDIANKEALTIATNEVVIAEGSKSQTDVIGAKFLVDALVSSDDKTALQNRLKVVQESIFKDAMDQYQKQLASVTNEVVIAEGSKSQTDVNGAKFLVDELPNGTDKTDLLNRLAVVQNVIDTANKEALTNATNAVVIAEGSKSQADVDGAIVLIDALPDGTAKTDLLSRWMVVQNAIDTANANATNTATQQALTNATNSVVKAEGSKLQADLNSAKTLVNGLPSGTAKTDLLSRLNVVQKAIDDANIAVQQQKVTGITISGANNITAKNETVQLSTSVTPSTASNKSVTWSSSDESVATINSSGVVTAKVNGTVIIRATVIDGSGISGQTTITVTGQEGTTATNSSSVLKSVSISGTEEVGHTLRTKVKYDGTKPSLEYQWQRASTKDGNYSDINGATDDNYKLKSSDNNKYIKLVATTTIDGQTYDVEDITSKIDKASSSDSSSDTSSDVSDSSSNNTTSTDNSSTMGSVASTNATSGTKSTIPGNTSSNSSSPAYGRFTNPSGGPVSGWINSNNGKWYYLDNNGIAQVGWINVNSNWYYLNPNSDTNRATMKTGWVKDNGKWYYLSSSGAMVRNITIDGYRIGSDGAWIE